MVQFIRLRGEFFGLGFGLYCSGRTDGRTASQLLALREAARMVPDCAQPIILAYGTCASAKISRHSAGAWLTRIAPKSKSTSTNCAYPPIKFEVSTQY